MWSKKFDKDQENTIFHVKSLKFDNNYVTH